MCTQCTLQHFYMQYILGVIIIIWLKKMTIIKLGFIFSFLIAKWNVFFSFLIAKWNVFFLFRNLVLCIWLSNEGIKHQFHLSLNYFFILIFFGKQREFTITIKTCCDHSLKNKVFIILVVVCTFCRTNISAALSGAGFHNPLHSPRHMCCGDVTIKVIW